MDAVEYLNAKEKICNTYTGCNGCPLLRGDSCSAMSYEERVELVEKWAKEHIKTYAQDFIEKFPNVKLTESRVPIHCRIEIYSGFFCPKTCSCTKCWNTIMDR